MRRNIALKRMALALQAMVMVLGVMSASVAGVIMSAAPASAVAAAAPAAPAAGGGTTCDTTQIGAGGTNPLASGAQCSQGGSQKSTLFGSGGIFTVAANTLIFLVGAIAVIYLIIGGLRYVTSGGDSKAVTAAKDTILYAVIGIVVAIISYALVSFVVTALGNAS